MQEKIGWLPQKKGKGKLPLFCGNGEGVIPIYASWMASLNLDPPFSPDAQSHTILYRCFARKLKTNGIKDPPVKW